MVPRYLMFNVCYILFPGKETYFPPQFILFFEFV